MDYTAVNIFVPTYKRPKWLKRFIESALDCCDLKKQIYFTFLVNQDDADSDRVLRFYNRRKNFKVLKNEWDTTGDNPSLSKYYNQCYKQTPFNAPGVCVSMFGDDMVFESKGFDTRFLEAVNKANGYTVAYGDDCYVQHQSMCVHMVTTREMVEATNRPFMCELFQAQAIDTVWYLVCKATGLLSYLPDVKVHHYHNSALPPEERDETFARLQDVTLSYAARKPLLSKHIDYIISQLRQKGIARA